MPSEPPTTIDAGRRRMLCCRFVLPPGGSLPGPTVRQARPRHRQPRQTEGRQHGPSFPHRDYKYGRVSNQSPALAATAARSSSVAATAAGAGAAAA